jgi:hypothetical protein
MATPQLSPGVLIREVDLTVGRAENVLDNIGAIAGPFSIGPVDEAINISNERELLAVFGKPSSIGNDYEYWMSASSYLSYGGVLKVVRSDGSQLDNSNAAVGSASTALKIKNFDDYILNYSDESQTYYYASKNPGTWANGLKVCTIDDVADQIIGIGITNPSDLGINVGVGVTTPLIGENIAGDGVTSVFDGYLKGIVTEIATSGTGSQLSIKILSRVSSDGVETPILYNENNSSASIESGDTLYFNDSNGDLIGLANPEGFIEDFTFSGGSTILGEADESYSILSTIGGTGIGATFTITRDSIGDIDDVVIVSGGSGYNVGDQLLITGSQIGGGGNIETVTSSGTAVGTAATFTGVTGSTAGNGVGASFDIERDGSGAITSVTVNNPGFRYAVGNTIVILGSDVGGVDDTDDVNITITGILVNSIINYTTKSKNVLGPISKVRLISNGRNYKKLPVVGEIITQFGKGSSLKVRTNTIGKIQKLIIEDIGFDYFSDNSLRPFAKIPEILRVNPLSSLDTIKVLFFGEQYNFPPDLVLLDGITQKIVKDVILDFNFNNNFVFIVKNTSGINDVIPTIIPINNSNGTNISSIENISENNTIKVFLDQEYSNINEFPFTEVVATTLNDVEEFTDQIIVDDASKIPQFSIIKIFNPSGLIIEDEVLYVKEKNNNTLIVERGYLGTEIKNAPFKYDLGSLILLLEKNVLIENVNILNGTGNQYNSENYEFKLYPLIQITPQLGGQESFITLDFSEILNPGEFFGTYDANSSFGIVTPQKYFPKFEITLKKNIFFVGETVISGNKSGVVEFWDSKNELLKINTTDDFNINSIITGKSSSYNGVISDIFKFKSFYDIDSSSIVVRSWQDSIGFLNDDLQRIHNNEYYQYFSYSLKSIIQYNDWESAVSSLNHTSGFKKFSDLDVEIKNPTFISDDGTEKLYAGIQTSQNKGNFTSLANIDSFAKFSCRSDYDLVSENSDKINDKLISDQIYFESEELLDYFNCIGNIVLSIDDISGQFRNTERLNIVNRFPL